MCLFLPFCWLCDISGSKFFENYKLDINMYSSSRHLEVSKFLMHLMQSLASLRDVLREHETFTYIISLL